MHRRPLLLMLFLAFLATGTVQAQGSYTISGIVKDNVNETLIGASVSLKNGKDSAIAGTSVDLDGHFALADVPSGPYRLTISYLGYDDYNKEVNVLDAEVNLGIIKMSVSQSTKLNEVKIVERIPPVQQKEDTTQFNAGSYKVNPDATAEDLIRKMPGMDLSTGKPQAQGEQVAKVLVDGKPFFGDDPTSSLRNLPAEVIDKIQVYDEKSDQSQFTGFDDGNTSKTINIITKANRRQGVFGKVYAGGGSDGVTDNDASRDFKYNAGGNINFFEGNRRISLIGQTNNINIQNFSPQDLLGISGGSGGRGFGGGGGMGRGGSGGGGMMGGGNNAFNVGTQNGISKTNAIGLNYSDKWGKKIDVTASYFFNNSDNVTTQDIERGNYVTPQLLGQTYHESNSSHTVNNNHRFNMRFNYTIDSSNSILFVPSLSFQSNNSSSFQDIKTLDRNSDMLNSSNNTYNSDLSGYNMNGLFLYRHKFKKKGRTLSLFANGGYNRSDGNSNLYAPVTNTDTSYVLNQKADYLKNGWNINSNLNYTEPLSRKSFLQIQYGLNYQQSKSDKRTYNFSDITNDYTDPDTLLSNTFNTDYLTHRGGLTYRYSDTSFNFNVGVDFQNANLDNQRILPYNSNLQRSFNTIMPSARLQYNFDKKKNLRLFYRTSTTAPSVDQLQNVINNTNPVQQSTGNPDLVQSYQHMLMMRYSATNTKLGSTFFAMLSGTATQHYIANSTIIAGAPMQLENGVKLGVGDQFTRPVNMDGYYNLRSFVTYGLPVTALKSNLNVNASATYTRTPGIINEQKNYAGNTALGLGLVISSNISEKIDFTLSSNSNYNIVNNTLLTASNNRFFNQASRLSINYIFWKGIVFNTELNHQYYTGLSAGFNQNFLLWNMSLAKKLFKKQQGEIKLSVYDLLKQNNSIVPTVTESYTQYTQTNVLRQYFLLTFTYNLRFFKGGASMKDVENSDRNRRGDFPGPGPGMMDGPPPGVPPMMPPPGGMR
ncbi:outer membrane beta-barrel protein [Taibaiella koreensis]|uniref:outer membrane beta-barrel protein n=1 Tax=Taibaiella koreensis TaxID=1268548 RepID=UPI0013C2B822|nr:outer membrane beta-barrel protein [Taibaiella koreensis]